MPEDLARGIAEAAIAAGIDVAVSLDMTVDHGWFLEMAPGPALDEAIIEKSARGAGRDPAEIGMHARGRWMATSTGSSPRSRRGATRGRPTSRWTP